MMTATRRPGRPLTRLVSLSRARMALGSGPDIGKTDNEYNNNNNFSPRRSDYVDAILGDFTQASMWYAKANYHTISDNDTSNPKSWIVYPDCNNLYGWAMSQYKAYGGFKWLEPILNGLYDLSETAPFDQCMKSISQVSRHLHVKHNDLPFIPQKSLPPGSKVQKLMVTLGAEFRGGPKDPGTP